MPNIDVSADILEFMQAADYAEARALLQDTAPYYGLICSKTGIDATVATTHYGTFATGVTTANATPLAYIFRYGSGTFAEARIEGLFQGAITGFVGIDLSSLDANRAYYVQCGALNAANYKPLTGADGFGVNIATPNVGAAVFAFYAFGIIEP